MTISTERIYTCDDAFAAAETLREARAGHEALASQIAADAGIDALSDGQLEKLCRMFGVEI
jgi:hypothetical protein